MKSVKINCLLLVLSVFSATILRGQSFCGTPYQLPNQIANLPPTQLNNGPYTIRVFVHVIRTSAGTGGQTSAEVTQALNILAADFGLHNICFSLLGSDFINNDGYFNFNGSTFNTLITVNAHSDAIDLYLLPNSAWNAGRASGIPGSALVIGGNLFGSNLVTSHVISHEMGHCLGLFHTFHGSPAESSGSCPELVNGSNGTSCGDFVADTPADPCTHFPGGSCPTNSSCVWVNTTLFDANNQLYNPDENVIMTYVSPSCMQYLTSGEGQRMRDHIATQPILQARTVPNQVFVQNKSWNTGNILYAARQSVTAGKNVTTGTIGNVTTTGTARTVFKAGNFVALMPGFVATPSSGGIFSAYIETFCSVVNQPNSALKQLAQTNTAANNKSEEELEKELEIEHQAALQTGKITGLIYPNPADQQLMVNYKTPQDVQIQVINMLGRVVKTATLPKNQVQLAIETNDLVNGMYVIRLYDSTGKTVKTEKFTVRHD